MLSSTRESGFLEPAQVAVDQPQDGSDSKPLTTLPSWFLEGEDDSKLNVVPQLN